MKRLMLTLVAVAVLVGSLGIISQARHAVADDARSIPLIITGKQDASGACNVPSREGKPFGMYPPHEIVIEDASGTIVASRRLTDFAQSEIIPPLSGSTRCLVQIAIAVPDSAFYRVMADDVFVTVISAAELPIAVDPSSPGSRVPWLDFAAP